MDHPTTIIIITFFVVFSLYLVYMDMQSTQENYRHADHSLTPMCLNSCDRAGIDPGECLDVCDDWVFNLSSGLRSRCPMFLSEQDCLKSGAQIL